MLVNGQLLREAANQTLGYSEPSRWADAWAHQLVVYDLTSSSSPASYLGITDNQVELIRPVPVFRFEYYSLAERLANSWSHNLPAPTGYSEIGELYSPGPLGEVAEEDSPADALVRDVIDWLNITYEELSQITGIGRSTLFYWRKKEGSPRVVNNRNIYRIHALASLLVKRFGVAGAQSWLQTGPDRPWDFLIDGDVESVETLLRSTLFGQRDKNFASRTGIADEIDLPPLAKPRAAAPLRAKRRPRRGRLERDD
jgi:hypothetical protein